MPMNTTITTMRISGSWHASERAGSLANTAPMGLRIAFGSRTFTPRGSMTRADACGGGGVRQPRALAVGQGRVCAKRRRSEFARGTRAAQSRWATRTLGQMSSDSSE